jgi:hypothetical protein
MQHMESSGKPVLYIGRTVLKGTMFSVTSRRDNWRIFSDVSKDRNAFSLKVEQSYRRKKQENYIRVEISPVSTADKN